MVLASTDSGNSGGKSGSRSKHPKTSQAKSQAKSQDSAAPARRFTRQQIRRNRLIALALLILAVLAMVFAIRAVAQGFTKWRIEQAAQARAYQLSREIRTFDPPKACDISNLEFTLSHPSALVVQGSGDSGELTVKNIGKQACTTVMDPNNSGIEIRSGNQIVYNSSRCVNPDNPKIPLLLDIGMSWKYSFGWDSMVQNPDCSAPTVQAAPGTYRILPLWEGTWVGSETVFAIIAPPPAPPEAASPAPAQAGG